MGKKIFLYYGAHCAEQLFEVREEESVLQKMGAEIVDTQILWNEDVDKIESATINIAIDKKHLQAFLDYGCHVNSCYI